MTAGTTMQTAFVSGELSPAMFGRVDHAKYKFGASTMRNGFVNFQGGYASRAGTAYVGMCKQGAPNTGGTLTTNPPRDIPFQFSVTQGYILEFGDQYMRIKFQGAYVTESTKSITAISQANPAVFTSTAHGFSNGDWVFISGVVGMTKFNGLTWVVANKTTNTFEVTDLFGNTVNSTIYPAYISGGTVARIYTVVSPYAAIDLTYLKYTQSADEMSLTCWNQETLTEYPPYDLQRLGNTNWVFTETSYSSPINPPVNVAVTAQSSTTKDTWYSYVVTAVDSVTNAESIASLSVQVQNNNISINAGSNTITWTQVVGAASYNIYSAFSYYGTSGTPIPQIGVPYGYLGTALGNSFVDTNIIADFTTTPPLHTDPFARGQILAVQRTNGGSGLSQGTIGFNITTSTGSGFEGIPIVSNGTLSGFLVQETGAGYLNTDTITITTGGASASGTYTFSGSNPTDGQTIILNGVTWTFKTAATTAAQTQIQGTLDATVQQLAADLASSGNTSITAANYSATTDVLTITYGDQGTAGNAYTLAAGTYAGSVSAATLTGGVNGVPSSATASLTVGPESGTYPGVVAYFQERRAYASTQNNPDTYYMSQPGAFTDMDSSIPSVDSDAITGTPWAQQVNGIQFMTPMPGGVVIFTGAGLWQLSGGNANALTPADQDVQPQSRYGCSSTVPPIPINFHILSLRENNGIVYDYVYNFFANIYTGSDLTVFSSHLFQGRTITQWAYAEKPSKLVWAVRDDGVMLSLTYIAEQEEQGWARHDTNGLFIGVCGIEEPPVDAIYTIVQRNVNGVWPYYAERFDNRLWTSAEDCFCVDAGLTYPMTFPNATLTAAAAQGTNNITSTLVSFGGSGYTSPTASAVDSTGEGSGAAFTVTVSGGVITAVTPTVSGKNYTAGETQIIITDSTGGGAVIAPIITNNVVFSASASVFSSANIGNVIRTGNGLAIIVSQTGTACLANITVPITVILQNNPNNTPVPAISGLWSLSMPTSVVNGLNHLEGMTVTGLADGGVITPTVVNNGEIVLPQSASAITVGLPFTAQLQALYLEIASPNTIQTKRKTIPSIGVRVHNTRGISVGTNQPDASTQPGGVNAPWTNLIQVKERNQSVPMGYPIELFTGDYFVNVPSDWNIAGQVAVEQSNPLPANIDGFVSYWDLGDSVG